MRQLEIEIAGEHYCAQLGFDEIRRIERETGRALDEWRYRPLTAEAVVSILDRTLRTHEGHRVEAVEGLIERAGFDAAVVLCKLILGPSPQQSEDD